MKRRKWMKDGERIDDENVGKCGEVEEHKERQRQVLRRACG